MTMATFLLLGCRLSCKKIANAEGGSGFNYVFIFRMRKCAVCEGELLTSPDAAAAAAGCDDGAAAAGRHRFTT